MSDDFITKFRSQTLDDILGNKTTVKTLRGFFKEVSKLPHAFIFAGKPGTGKTSISRIIANYLNCETINITEVDAGIFTGVDNIRDLIEKIQYKAFGDNPIKFIIIDEAQSLSQPAWKALLKSIEEPKDHIYWSFCTTEFHLIPKAVKSRCHSFLLEEVDSDEIFLYLKDISLKENLELSDDCIKYISTKCDGSPRLALNYLSKCRFAENVKEVAELLNEPLEDKEVLELCQAIVYNKPWKTIQELVKSFKSVNHESVRIQVAAYIAACVANAKTEKEAGRFLGILYKFREPIRSGYADLVFRIGDAMLGE